LNWSLWLNRSRISTASTIRLNSISFSTICLKRNCKQTRGIYLYRELNLLNSYTYLGFQRGFVLLGFYIFGIFKGFFDGEFIYWKDEYCQEYAVWRSLLESDIVFIGGYFQLFFHFDKWVSRSLDKWKRKFKLFKYFNVVCKENKEKWRIRRSGFVE
jgi:hypothetical protein